MSKIANKKKDQKKKMQKKASNVKKATIAKNKHEGKQKVMASPKKAKNKKNKELNQGKTNTIQKEAKVANGKEKPKPSPAKNKSKSPKKGKKIVQGNKKGTVATDDKNKFMLYVTNLAPNTGKNSLEKHFTTVAPVKKLMLFTSKRKNRAIVDFETEEDCLKGLTLQGSKFNDRVINVARSIK